MVELSVVRLLAEICWTRLAEARRDQRGMTTETVIITAGCPRPGGHGDHRHQGDGQGQQHPHGVRGTEGGSATTQVVLVTPVLLTLLMTVVQIGLWFHASHLVTAAAGGSPPRPGTGGHRRRGPCPAQAFLDALGREVLTSREVTASRGAEVARVEVRGTTAAVVPGVHLPVAAASEGPVEEFRAP